MISYSTKDWDLVEPIVSFLEENGVDVWLDKERIKPPMVWRLELLRAPQHTDGIIPFLSANYVQSEMCRMELYVARSFGRSVFPIMIEECWDKLDKVEETKYLASLLIATIAPPKIVGLPVSRDEVLSRILRALNKSTRISKRTSPNVYISYSYTGAKFADHLHRDLERRGIPSWIATQNCEIGEDWRSAQVNAMANSDVHLVVINENFFEYYDVLRTEIIMSEVYNLPTFCIYSDTFEGDPDKKTIFFVIFEMVMKQFVDWLNVNGLAPMKSVILLRRFAKKLENQKMDLFKFLKGWRREKFIVQTS